MSLAIGQLWDQSKSKSLGTAFAISKDKALTAFHCVGDNETGDINHPEVILRFLHDLEIIAEFSDGSTKLDYAILKLERPLPTAYDPIPLLTEAKPLDDFRCLGYPAHSAVSKMDITPIIGKVTDIEGSIHGGAPAVALESSTAANDLPLHGMSGAPVLVGTPEAAIGLIRWNPQRPRGQYLSLSGIVYACPTRSIVEAHSELEELIIVRDPDEATVTDQTTDAPLLSLPAPDDTVLPLHFPVYQPAAETFENLPFDLATVWGLERAGFAGILARAAGNELDIYHLLCRAEITLQDDLTIQYSDRSCNLSRRYWLLIDLLKRPTGPVKLEDIWLHCVTDPDSALVQNLTSGQLPPATGLGLVYRWPVNAGQPAPLADLIICIQKWIERLAQFTLPEIAPILIIDIQCESCVTATALARELEQDLLTSAVTLPLEVLIYRCIAHEKPHAAHQTKTESVPVNPFLRPLPASSPAKPGAKFCQFMTVFAEQHVAELSMSEVIDKHQALIGRYRELYQEHDFDNTATPARASCQDVINDLDSLPANESALIDRQLLQLIERCDQPLLYELVGAYAQSIRASARYESLRVAARSDKLMDVWLAKVNLEVVKAFTDTPPQADLVTNRRLIDDLALAMLRTCRHAPFSDHVELLNEWMESPPLLSQEVIPVCKHVLNNTPVLDFFNEFNLRTLIYATRVGIPVVIPASSLDQFNWDSNELWWLITSLPPHALPLAALCTLPDEYRAILGLIDPAQRQYLLRDTTAKTYILDRRRRRPL